MGKLIAVLIGLVAGSIGFVAAIVALVWLGRHGLFLFALGSLVLAGMSPFLVFGHVMMPSVLSAMILRAQERNASPLEIAVLSLPAQLYQVAIITVWCMLALYFCFSRAKPETELPLLVLAFAVSVGPWDCMSSFDEPLTAFMIPALAKLGCVLSFAYLHIARPETYTPCWLIFAATMLAGVTWSTINAYRILDAGRRDSLSP